LPTMGMHRTLRINGNNALVFEVPGISEEDLKAKVAQSMKDGAPLALDVVSGRDGTVQLLLNPQALTTVEIPSPSPRTMGVHRMMQRIRRR
jgi:hypothetical protein